MRTSFAICARLPSVDSGVPLPASFPPARNMSGAKSIEGLRFGPDYAEDVTLGDGTKVRLRLVRPSDKPLLAQGLMRLSPKSQYLRFFTAKTKFTPQELDYLTELDGYDHFAIAVGRVEADGSEGDGVAVGRFVRLPGEPTVAEPAVAVVDEMQGRGLGRLLMQRLIEAARERDVKVFRSEFLSVNTPMRTLLASLSSDARFHMDGALMTAEFSIAPEDESGQAVPENENPIYEVLKLVAQRTLQMRRVFSLLFDSGRIREDWVQWGRDLGRELGVFSDEDDEKSGDDASPKALSS